MPQCHLCAKPRHPSLRAQTPYRSGLHAYASFQADDPYTAQKSPGEHREVWLLQTKIKVRSFSHFSPLGILLPSDLMFKSLFELLFVFDFAFDADLLLGAERVFFLLFAEPDFELFDLEVFLFCELRLLPEFVFLFSAISLFPLLSKIPHCIITFFLQTINKRM